MTQLARIENNNDLMQIDENIVRARVLERIKEIKSDPAKYDELKAKLKTANSDEARTTILVDFITTNEDLITTIPNEHDERIKAATSITLTTIFIFASPAK